MKHRSMDKAVLVILALLLFSLLFAPLAAVADVLALLDRSTIYQGESFTLTLSVDGARGSSEPDLSPLAQEFQVLGSSTSQQIQIINGRRSDKTLWLVQLEPKRLGRIEIPAIDIGGERTRPLVVTVREVPEQSNDQKGQSIFLEVELNPDGGETYVQQQIRYRVRLFLDGKLLNGSLSEPSPEDAVVERLGEDKRYRVKRDGREYQVIERNYAIFPEKSGELQISPVRFKGQVLDPRSSPRRSQGRSGSLMERFFGEDPFASDPFFQNMPSFGSDIFSGNSGRPVTIRSKAGSLSIQPRPAGYSGRYWLPSAGLGLHDSWSKQPPEFRAGEPVTRTITIEAKGLESSQIPRIELTAPQGVRVYPEPPVTETRTDGSWVFGRSRQSWTYVPSRPGGLEIPEISLTWWDTGTRQEQVARLPPWKLKVLPGVDAGIAAVTVPPATTNSRAGDALQVRSEPQGLPLPGWLKQGWTGLVAVLLLLALLSLLLWRHRSAAVSAQGGPERNAPDTLAPGPGSREALAHLQRACQGRAAAAAAKALLELGASRWPEDPPGSLGALAARLERGGDQLRLLDRALYARKEADWDGEQLWREFEQGIPGQRAPAGVREENSLDPLYPQRA